MLSTASRSILHLLGLVHAGLELVLLGEHQAGEDGVVDLADFEQRTGQRAADLALELDAAALREQHVAALADRLGQRLGLLQQGGQRLGAGRGRRRARPCRRRRAVPWLV
jgi:hypothetical protein